jgi:lysophospholipase L1-like esterase
MGAITSALSGDSLRFARLLFMAVLSGSLALVAGCASESPPVSGQVQKSYDVNSTLAPTPTAQAVTFAAVGDSITVGDSPDFNGGKFGSLSWPSLAPPGTKFAGGWAVSGATTAAMASAVKPAPADVLVVIAGTNDLINGVPFVESAANLQAIVTTVGAKRVVVSSVPPLDPDPAASTDYNGQLQALAVREGWAFVDAMAGVRDGEVYAEGMTADGIHPTAAGVKMISTALAAGILE